MKALETLEEFAAMRSFKDIVADPRMAAAIDEIQRTVDERYPGTTYSVEPGEDPGTVWMWAEVDVDDSDEVYDLVAERLLDLKIEHGIPLLFIPIWTRARNDAYWRDYLASRSRSTLSGNSP